MVATVAVIAIGLDVVEMPRARDLFLRHGERILARTLTQDERAYVLSLGDPVPAFAARLAAKEAVYKALQIFDGARGIVIFDLYAQRETLMFQFHGSTSLLFKRVVFEW